ncbi:unnamed protein product, partial [Mesorhabditis belari]|uniref:Neurotransmitter-gated ion-channel ligand-binding domain-containing protein n=1 Tax=Mesorhabditis belari TaxID=2138241 RepID=A0AAF3EYI3_9BILA
MFEPSLLYAASERTSVTFDDQDIRSQISSGWNGDDDQSYAELISTVPAHCLQQPQAEALSRAFASNSSLPFLHIIYSFILLNSRVQCLSEHFSQIDDITKILALNPRYNKNAYPTQNIDKPTDVKVQMYIEGMSSFRAQSMDFQIDIYLQEMWVDERLKHNNTKRILIKDPKLFSLIWHPDLYFANARTASFHEVTMPNFLVWIYPNGTVWYDCRVSGSILCAQNLAKYPLDRQMCYLRILSCKFSMFIKC